MATANDLITQSLKKAGVLGVGVSPEGEDVSDALADLNDMIAQWRRQRWLIYRLRDLSFVSTGAQSYTVGAASNFVISPRPDRLEGAYVRQITNVAPNQVDFTCELIESRETYSRIALKQLTSFAYYAWYDPSYPVGEVRFWPIPQAAMYECHILVKDVIDEIPIADIGTEISLPAEYWAAIKFNLARRLRSSYRLPPDAELNALAKDALAILRGANAQIPTLVMPADLVRAGIYDPYSDQIY